MLKFDTEHNPPYGEVEEITPLIRRLTANNPGKFTFKGTGTYIIGTDSVAVIDPGPKEDAHIESLLAALKGVSVSHILITHTHRDHSPAAIHLKEEVGGILCGFGPHPADASSQPKKLTGELTGELREDPANEDDTKDGAGDDVGGATEESGDKTFMPEKFVGHGDILVGQDWSVECLHTPGHISNHLCFVLLEEKSIFTGDHVMGWSTSIIPPPDGNLDDYLNSLHLLLEREEDVYYPTHGPPILNAKKYTEELIQHRQNRSLQILGCLGDSPKTIPEIVGVIYKDHPEELHKPAAQSVWSHLIYLHKEGKVKCPDEPKQDSAYSIRV